MKVFCINLDKRTDRWEQCLDEFKRIGLPSVQRIAARVETTPLDDCAMDHASCAGLGIINHDEMCLIMEDDVKFLVDSWKRVEDVIAELTAYDPLWDMLYLGINADPDELRRSGPPARLTANLYRVQSGFATHAYVIRSSVYQRIVQLVFKCRGSGIPHDVIYSRDLLPQVRAYCVNPLMAVQRPSFSSILNRFVDYDYLKERWQAAIDAAKTTSIAAMPTRKAIATRLPIGIVTETMNYVSGGVRCIAEVLNRLRDRGYDARCYVTTPDLRCDWLKINFPIHHAHDLEGFSGVLVSPYSPTAQLVADSSARAKFYWVHSYEPKFPEITGRPDSWRIMSEESYRLPNVHYFAVSTYVRMILDLIYKVKVLTPLVPGGVDTQLFYPRQKPPSSNLRLMFLSRGHEFRGADDVIDALLEVYGRGQPNLEIFAMGYPIDLGGIPHTQVPALPQPEFAALLGTMDIFIHPSHFEGLPLPPLEAMASRCAVISTYVGAIDYLLDGINALVVLPKRPDLIAAAIERLANDKELRESIAETGYKVVLSNYTWDHTVDRFEEALREGLRSNIKIAIIVPAHIPSPEHHKALLERCIRSLNAQTFKAFKTIFVVNGFYEEDTSKLIQSIEDACQFEYTIIDAKSKCGIARAKNIGVEHAGDADYIGFLDADDEYHPLKLQQQFEYLATSPIDILGTLAYEVDSKGQVYTSCFAEGQFRTTEQIASEIEKQNVICGASVLIRKAIYLSLGGFNCTQIPGRVWEQYGRPMWEDWDMWIRAIKSGYSVETLDDRLYYWYHGLSVPREF